MSFSVAPGNSDERSVVIPFSGAWSCLKHENNVTK